MGPLQRRSADRGREVARALSIFLRKPFNLKRYPICVSSKRGLRWGCMAEVLTAFDEQFETNDGFVYAAQACGAPNSDGLWEGWIEFIPLNGGPALRSPRETTQPNRADAQYWATGLSAIYLEGAFGRARNPIVRHSTVPAEPLFDEPAPMFVASEDIPSVDAVLDPFSVTKKAK